MIRAWVERGSSSPLRAHVRVLSDVSTGRSDQITLAHPEAVGELVDDWLRGLLASTATTPSDHDH